MLEMLSLKMHVNKNSLFSYCIMIENCVSYSGVFALHKM